MKQDMLNCQQQDIVTKTPPFHIKFQHHNIFNFQIIKFESYFAIVIGQYSATESSRQCHGSRQS